MKIFRRLLQIMRIALLAILALYTVAALATGAGNGLARNIRSETRLSVR
jgi:hypothetical protein